MACRNTDPYCLHIPKGETLIEMGSVSTRWIQITEINI